MYASLEFAMMSKQPVGMQRGQIYESAVVVFWQEKRCVTIAGAGGDTGDCLVSRSRYAGFLTLLQWLCRGFTCKLGTEGNHVSTSTLWLGKISSAWHSIFHAGNCLPLFCAKCKLRNLHVRFFFFFLPPHVTCHWEGPRRVAVLELICVAQFLARN